MDRPIRVLVYCLAAMTLAVPAMAQSAPTVELSGGYQFLNFSSEGESESMPAGWYFDVAGNLTPMLGIVVQVGGNYKTFDESITVGGITASASADLKVHEFLGGVRVNSRSNAAIVPFGQVLAGAVNASIKVNGSATLPGQPPIVINQEDSGTNFAIEAGGGVNFGLSDNLGLRVGADYLRVFADEGGANVFRFAVGIVIGR
jgi:opacity protein-like surface antigen